MIIRTLEALFTLKTNAVDFRKATSDIDRFAANANSVLGAITGHFVFQAISGFVTENAHAMAEVGRSAGLLGLATSALQEMHYAAQKSGVAIDTLDDSLKELQIRAVDSLSGKGEAFDAFDKLKVDPKNGLGQIRAPLDLLDEVADKLIKLPTQSERLWVVDSMFGDQGAMMLKMLKGGSKGLAEMRAEARSLGHVLSSDAIVNAEKFNEALNRLKTSSTGVKQNFVADLIPGLSWVSDKLSALNVATNQIVVPLSVVRIAFISLSGVLVAVAIKGAIAFAPIIFGALAGVGTVLAMGAAVILLAAIVEDLWVAFKGGDSVIASAWDGIKNFTLQAAGALGKGLEQAWDSANKEYANFSKKGFSEIAHSSSKGFSDAFLSAKKEFAVMLDYGPQQARMAPNQSHIANQNRLTSNQNVNVAVNVKTGADPQAIGGEVSKAVRTALEKERFNAFMGVSQYAN